MKNDYGGSFQCKSDTPKETIDKWFNIFREEYLEKKSNMATLGETVTDNKLYYDTVGDYHKGIVYGLGVASNLYYEPPSKPQSNTYTSSTQYTPGIVSQLQDEKEQRKLIEERFNKEVEENKKFREEMEAKFAQLQNICRPLIPHQPRDDEDPSGEGSGSRSVASVRLEDISHRYYTLPKSS